MQQFVAKKVETSTFDDRMQKLAENCRWLTPTLGLILLAIILIIVIMIVAFPFVGIATLVAHIFH